MSKFMVDLDESKRLLLEAHRRRLGARSLADAIRLLIDPPPTEYKWTEMGVESVAEADGSTFLRTYSREQPLRAPFDVHGDPLPERKAQQKKR